ncbi:MAG: nitrate reductase molybdenum cofactor assembly chaperone [Streptococcaceae bacterium]|nr:nitrate reductase molybdenum cofactor assembly chaperone [Streptococcaceae bacterium]
MTNAKTIDVNKLNECRPVFSLLSQFIEFPNEELMTVNVKKELSGFSHVEDLIATAEEMQNIPLQTLQEHYSTIFELNKRITLYSTYYRFQDSRERGTALAKLKMLYEMFGVELGSSEMADYLPAMLEFLSIGEWDQERINDLQFLIDVIEDGTYEILKQADEYADDYYIKLIAITRDSLKSVLNNK